MPDLTKRQPLHKSWLQEPDEPFVERRRALAEARDYAHRHKAAIDAEWDALEAPPLTLAQHIEHAAKLRANINAFAQQGRG